MKHRLSIVLGLSSLCAAMVLLAPARSAQSVYADAPASEPTFARDVAPIIFENCTGCHRPGQVGPFPLTSYEEVASHARQIARVTDRRIMPPWKPQPGWNHFAEERTLSDEEIETLARWSATGRAQGDPALTPSLPEFPEGWQLGEPDIVLTMDEAMHIPAEGEDLYMHFVFPIEMEGQEVYIKGVEVCPGNPRVVHHAVGLLDAGGDARRLDAAYPGPGYLRFGDAGFLPAGITPGYVPGQTPRLFDEGAALTVKDGTDFVLQIHYHPSGRPEQDQTQIGLYLTDEPPTRKMLGVLMACDDIDIPAGDNTYTVYDRFELPVGMAANSIWAHMHLIGKEVKVWAELPDGTVQKLLWIDNWDFNWQDTYIFEEPIYLPARTVIRSEWRYDNTAENPRNPNHPPQRVTVGENSTDEMAGLWIGGEVQNDWEMVLLLGANIGHYLDIMNESEAHRQRRRDKLSGSSQPPPTSP